MFEKIVKDLDREVNKSTVKLNLDGAYGFVKLGFFLTYTGTTVAGLPVEILINGWIDTESPIMFRVLIEAKRPDYGEFYKEVLDAKYLFMEFKLKETAELIRSQAF